MSKYFPSDFEEKWAAQWVEDGLFQQTSEQTGITPDPPSHKATEGRGNKMYLLYAFAYPSGSGLHVGHVEPLTALDIMARYYRSIGKKVFFPVGWDAFGLPAENYAIQTGIPPVKTTKDAINTFSRQIKRIGVSYDWGAEIATCHPGYYKWTQWLFLQLYKKKLAYKKDAPVNWCPSCQTVLANEQVVEGTCERCGTDVVQKKMEQWFFKITQYMDELISGLGSLDWPKATKLQQLNWIGKSEGVTTTFKVQDMDIEMSVFDSVPQTYMAQTFTIIAPEHPLVYELVKGTDREEEVMAFVERVKKKKASGSFDFEKDLEGIFTGKYLEYPLAGDRKLPIWVASFAVYEYGTGIVNCSAHDDRDFIFAKKYGIPLHPVMHPEDPDEATKVMSLEYCYHHEHEGIIEEPLPFKGRRWGEVRSDIIDYLESTPYGRRDTNYKLRDWLISRQRYWGAPIPIVYDPEGNAHMVKEEHLPWMLPTDVDFKPTGESPLRLSKEFNERVEKLYGKGWTPEYDTMDTFVDSSWYYLRFTDPRNEQEFARTEAMKKWMPVDFYMIGPEHIVLHLLYSRFFTKFLRDEGYLSVDEPFAKMRHQGMILGPDHRKMSKSKGNVINPDDVINEYGADTLRMYEMFLGPIDQDKPWNVESVQGQYRFLKRVWKMFEGIKGSKDQKIKRSKDQEDKVKGKTQLVSLLHRTIKKVGDDIEQLKFNTAIATIMEFLNMWERQISNSKTQMSISDARKFLKILSPFAPFMTEELWRNQLGEKESIHMAPWPQVDESLLQKSTIIVPVQVNGKVRGRVDIGVNDEEDIVVEQALKDETIIKFIPEKTYKKVIYIKGKILNIIV
ncbi:leucine--tRNA ligase [Candidatus Roizmanbacteria bacterium CG10_big_fil_rev_8_21_14_0_10_39_12]|uniref:Leucine--tRNA ligase n=1 Tax=Candidatus Roizmanbacteria bacterium CG10_big_fil_rev_8_21_14_0_10_39_12 TaxID=1974852 RepID=A0A2M8KNT9_9BACT|nr:MAG: leucine--tRNA ligase [Candidatus Roizmanbacteria bacterium CG10_big_fil_rev_8_21_14_0_10_39_12]